MAVTDGTGLVKGKAWRIKVTFVRGGSPVDLSSYTVVPGARFAGSLAQFTPAIEPLDAANGVYVVSATATQMSDEPTDSDWLDLEFSFNGSPVLNPNATPYRLPVRPEFGAFVAPS